MSDFPESLGACIDLMSEIREQKRDAEKLVKLYADEYNALEAHMIAAFDTDDISKASGKKATASKSVEEIPTAENWDEFFEYVMANKASELVQKRPATKAIKERWENGEEVPGIGKFVKVKINLRNK